MLTDGFTVQVTLCCYYRCRDLESVLRCFKKNSASLWVNWLIDGAGYAMLLLRVPGSGVGAALHQDTDWLMAQVTLCCYYGCRDLELVLRCIKKNGALLCVNWLIDGAGYAMLLLRVPGSGVGAALHQEERRLTGAPGAVPLLSTPHGSSSLPQCSDFRNKAAIHKFQTIPLPLFYFVFFSQSSNFLHSIQLEWWVVTKLFVYPTTVCCTTILGSNPDLLSAGAFLIANQIAMRIPEGIFLFKSALSVEPDKKNTKTKTNQESIIIII